MSAPRVIADRVDKSRMWQAMKRADMALQTGTRRLNASGSEGWARRVSGVCAAPFPPSPPPGFAQAQDGGPMLRHGEASELQHGKRVSGQDGTVALDRRARSPR
ncbi:hypothetical protein ACJQWK_03711 [Exserohilum turcicum]